MKLHLPSLHTHGLHVDLRELEHKLHEEKQHLVYSHPWLISLIISCLIASLIITMLSAIHIYFSTGIWPLFG